MSITLARPLSPCCGADLSGGPVIYMCEACRKDVHGSTINREFGSVPQPADCSHLHGAFGAGCPWCTPRRKS